MGFLHDIAKRFVAATRALAGVFRHTSRDSTTYRTSSRDLYRLPEEVEVKRKLGRAFFTRQLNPNTKAARIASLTRDEWLLAKSKGWIR